MSKRDVAFVSTLLALLCVVSIVMMAVDATTAVRPPLVLAAMLTAPGWALMCWFKTVEWSVAWSTALGLSSAIVILISVGMLSTDLWHPRAATGALLAVAALVLSARGGHLLRLEARYSRPHS